MRMQYKAEDIKTAVAPGTLNVALVASPFNTFDFLLEFAAELRQNGHSTLILLLEGDVPSDSGRAETVFKVDPDELVRLDFISVFFVSDLNEHLDFPAHSRVVSFPHSLGLFTEASPPQAYIWNGRNTLWADCAVMPQRQIFNHSAEDSAPYFTGLFPASMFRRPAKNFSLIPGGYLKFDGLIRYFKTIQCTPNAIVYAPTATYTHHGRLLVDGEHIITSLLNIFPEYKIILRPYPREFDKAEIRCLAERFMDYENFHLDTDPFYKETYARAAVLLTDYSNTSHTFAFTKLTPSVHCRFDLAAGRSGDRPTRMDIGYEVHTIQQMTSAVTDILSNAEKWRGVIRKTRDRHMVRCDGAMRYLAQCIPTLAHGENLPDWTVMPKPVKRNIPSLDEAADKLKILLLFGQDDLVLKVLNHAMMHHPNETWLKALFAFVNAAQEEVHIPSSVDYYTKASTNSRIFKDFFPGLSKESDRFLHQLFSDVEQERIRDAWATMDETKRENVRKAFNRLTSNDIRKLVIYGANRTGMMVIMLLEEFVSPLNISAIVDGREHGKVFMGSWPIRPPEALQRIRFEGILICSFNPSSVASIQGVINNLALKKSPLVETLV